MTIGRMTIGEELQSMDRSYIFTLRNQIKWLVGYEARHRYDVYPTFKSSIVAMSRELRQRIRAFNKEWGIKLNVRI